MSKQNAAWERDGVGLADLIVDDEAPRNMPRRFINELLRGCVAAKSAEARLEVVGEWLLAYFPEDVRRAKRGRWLKCLQQDCLEHINRRWLFILDEEVQQALDGTTYTRWPVG